MSDIYLKTVTDVTAEVTGVSPWSLTPDTAFEDLDLDIEIMTEIEDRCIEALDASYGCLDWDDYAKAFRKAEQAQCLAPFSARAHAVFEENNLPYSVRTLGSFAWSLEAGTFLPSGRYGNPQFQALSKAAALRGLFGLPLLVFVGLTAFSAFAICDGTSQASAPRNILDDVIFGGGVASMFLALNVWPGLLTVWGRDAAPDVCSRQT